MYDALMYNSPCSPQVLAYEALYRCAGLGAYTVKQHFDFQGWFDAVLAHALEALDATMRAREHQVRRTFLVSPSTLIRVRNCHSCLL